MASIQSSAQEPNGIVREQPGIGVAAQGIVGDAMDLLKLQLAMFKAETRAQVKKLRAGAIALACSIGPMALGGLMLCFGLVHLLHWATVPAGAPLADPAAVPLWACYAIVAGACLLLLAKRTYVEDVAVVVADAEATVGELPGGNPEVFRTH